MIALIIILRKVRRPLLNSLLLTTALLISSCNQQEFYEKEFLEAAAAPNPVPTSPPDTTPEPSPVADEEPTPNFEEEPTPVVIVTPPEPTPVVEEDPTPVVEEDPTPVVEEDPTPVVEEDPTPVVDEDPTPVDEEDPTPVVEEEPTPVEEEPSICGELRLDNIADTFVQNVAQKAKVDILWVVDDSGSMRDEQEALARNFDVFIKDFIKKDIDFKMAITTTDRNYIGKIKVSNFSKLTAQAAKDNHNKFTSDFKKLIKVGIRGSGREMGLHTSTQFLNKFSDWMRTDAYLVVVYISDEEDQSYERNVSRYISELQAKKDEQTKFKAYSIVKTPSSNKSTSQSRLGKRYMEISQATGGPVADIDDDFHSILTNFGESIVNLLDSFTLSKKPVTNQIEVTVSQNQMTEGYVYSEEQNSISFQEGFVPREGEVIEANYQACVASEE